MGRRGLRKGEAKEGALRSVDGESFRGKRSLPGREIGITCKHTSNTVLPMRTGIFALDICSSGISFKAEADPSELFSYTRPYPQYLPEMQQQLLIFCERRWQNLFMPNP
jgi:hypothetical protein